MKKWDRRERDDQKQLEERVPVPTWCNLAWRAGWKGMEICGDWASPARHGRKRKCVFSHEMGEEAVFAPNLLFCTPKFPRVIPEEENMAGCEKAPSELCCFAARPCQGCHCAGKKKKRNKDAREIDGKRR